MRTLLALLLICIFISYPAITIPQFPFIIYGYTLSEDGEGIPNAIVIAKNLRSGKNMSTISTNTGRYSFLIYLDDDWKVGDPVLIEAKYFTFYGDGACDVANPAETVGINITMKASVIYVGGNGENNFTSIEEALKYINNGCKVYVFPNEYNENIIIRKKISLIGRGKNVIINGNAPLIINESMVNISQFLIKGGIVLNKGFCKIYNNSICDSNIAINVFSSNNEIFGNMIYGNEYGICLNSSNNTIYNNFFKNIKNALDNGYNTWNISKTYGKNIVGGNYIAGNYWHDYNGSDLNGDAIGDEALPYSCDGNISHGGDFMPLVTPWDVNGDGIVNILDMIMIGQHFGLSEGDENFDERADINKDGIINSLDMIIVGQNWMKVY